MALLGAMDDTAREEAARRADRCFRASLPGDPSRARTLEALGRLRHDGLALAAFDADEAPERFFTEQQGRPGVEAVLVEHALPEGDLPGLRVAGLELARSHRGPAVLEVLRHYGCRVHVPREQGCCGALHLHAGFRDAARPLIERNLQAFDPGLDAIVVDSAGCGSSMKEYGHWMPEAGHFAGQVRDFSEWLVELGTLPAPKAVQRKVSYDDPCHLCHGQGIVKPPRLLLETIEGLELHALPHSDDCCGSAGIYNLVQRELSDAVLERKMDEVAKLPIDTLLTANPGCHLQLEMGARRRGMELEVLHIAELLAEAWV